jgi:hypothetical protein
MGSVGALQLRCDKQPLNSAAAACLNSTTQVNIAYISRPGSCCSCGLAQLSRLVTAQPIAGCTPLHTLFHCAHSSCWSMRVVDVTLIPLILVLCEAGDYSKV